MTPAEAVESFFESASIPYRRVAPAAWAAQLRGERKLSIPVHVTITGERIAFESFFMRRPLENAGRLYDLLLRRNMRAYGVHFALDALGDVYLVGVRAVDGLDPEELDRIVGSILIEADGLFDAAVALGFASYLEADTAWRARRAAEAEAAGE